jgi:aminomethyltransferase
MGHKTALFREHDRMGARIVPFGGWDMPLHYGSQLGEHRAVRRSAGMFDVSHMRVVDLTGDGSRDFLRHLLANDVAKLRDAGKALYSCMLNEGGGVIDDLIVYFREPGSYRAVVNAATAETDLAWMQERSAGFDLTISPHPELAMIAVQGPQARETTAPCIPTGLRDPSLALKPFFACEAGDWFVGRTGYTGEDGFEIMLPANQAPALWTALADAGVAPCGLGARDTLRLEAGMNLYGQDMDEDVSPLESGLGWTIAWEPADRDFIGRKALEVQKKAGRLRRFVGLLLTGRGVLRGRQTVLAEDGSEAGEVTSGGFAPTLERSIALARVRADIGETCAVDIRGKAVPAKVVKPPFVRKGAACIELD